MNQPKRILNSSEIWSFEAQMLHKEGYEEAYISALQLLLKDKGVKILDTAGGLGFPTLNLIDSGYINITVTEGDADSVEIAKSNFKQKGLPVQVTQGLWQNLSETVKDEYDVLLNVDNSMVYMDGWTDLSNLVSGQEAMFERFRIVLKEFLKVLRPGGMAILGLGKHYDPKFQGVPEGANADNKVVEADLMRDNHSVKVRWEIRRDWEKRHHENMAYVTSDEFEGKILRMAYLITKEELMGLAKEVGFSEVRIVEPENTRDNFIVAIK